LANATVGASIVLDTALPLSLRPAAAKTFTLFVKDDSALVLPNLTTYTDGTVVVNTTGIINIYAGRGTTGTFAGTSVNGTSGFPGTALSYYV
jgi:hypothetical protein